jgi:cobyrinic acid a,c-diamide synthase
VPIYGECGGLMYLGRTLTDFEGRAHRMAGVVPLDSAMRSSRVVLGYRTARAVRSSLLFNQGATTMGHEFHYSELSHPVDEERAAYRLAERENACEGYAQGNVLATYVHMHFGGRPDAARRFVDACTRHRPSIHTD